MDNESPDEHSSLSRRGLVKGAAGAAAVGAVTLAASRTPAVAAAANAAASGADSAGQAQGAGGSDHSATVDGELVVHVRDARTGEMDVYAGTRHVAVRDAALAARLADAAR